MITTIDNNQRKFLIQSQGFGNSFDIFCNLKDIPAVLANEETKNSEIKIYEYWNRRLKVCSKKHLNEMFSANKIANTKFTFKFNGRTVGADGKFYSITASYTAKTLPEAEEQLYAEYEHITCKTVKETIINIIK